MSDSSKPDYQPATRPLQVLKTPVMPYAEFWQAMRHLSTEHSEAQKNLAKERDKMVVQLCEKIDDLRRVISLERAQETGGASPELLARLTTLETGFREVLAGFDYQVETYDGRKWQELSTAEVEMEGYEESADAPESIVSETLLPAVRHGGRIIQPARVMVRGPIRNENT